MKKQLSILLIGALLVQAATMEAFSWKSLSDALYTPSVQEHFSKYSSHYALALGAATIAFLGWHGLRTVCAIVKVKNSSATQHPNSAARFGQRKGRSHGS